MRLLLLISIFLLCSWYSLGQSTYDPLKNSEPFLNRSKNFVDIALGLELSRPFTIKNSYLNEAQAPNPGVGFDIDLVLYDYILLGYNIDSYSFRTTNPALTGTTKTNMFFSRFKVGLRLPIKERWAIDAFYYIEESTLLNSNIEGGDKLTDDVETLMFGTRVNYFLNKSVACFVNIDFTNLQFGTIVPEPLSQFYESENIIGLSLGFSFYLERF
jgi:hypothetical protein